MIDKIFGPSHRLPTTEEITQNANKVLDFSSAPTPTPKLQDELRAEAVNEYFDRDACCKLMIKAADRLDALEREREPSVCQSDGGIRAREVLASRSSPGEGSEG